MCKNRSRTGKLGFVRAVQEAVSRELVDGEWAGFIGCVDGRNSLERALDRLVNQMPFARDASNDSYVMSLNDHSMLCHLERNGGSSKGHPAYYRQAALLGVKVFRKGEGTNHEY